MTEIQKTSKPYFVAANHCSCHPETCCCNDWAVYGPKGKHSTYYDRETADDVADALNFKAMKEQEGV